MVADIAEHEADLVEVGEVIDDFRFLGIGGFGAQRACGGCEQRAGGGECRFQQAASVHGPHGRIARALPSASASVRPTGPAPTISTRVSTARLMAFLESGGRRQ